MEFELDGFTLIVVVAIISSTLYGLFGTSKYEKIDIVNAYKEGMEIVIEADPNTFDVDSAAMAFEINLNDEQL